MGWQQSGFKPDSLITCVVRTHTIQIQPGFNPGSSASVDQQAFTYKFMHGPMGSVPIVKISLAAVTKRVAEQPFQYAQTLLT